MQRLPECIESSSFSIFRFVAAIMGMSTSNKKISTEESREAGISKASPRYKSRVRTGNVTPEMEDMKEGEAEPEVVTEKG
jgi:hypothetical protein